MLLSLEQIAAFTGADVLGDTSRLSCEACGITWDSREVEPGFVYVALPGERVNGHDFVPAAFAAGACAALVMEDPSQEAVSHACDQGKVLLKVDSTHQAFTYLARGWRTCLSARVIGLTGSTGKTTTKNLVRDVLSSAFRTVATKANQNNELGVPRTVLNADPDTEMVVVEMGMRGLGQIAELCEFVKPEWGLITNVGESHIELLGSRENIARAKGELIAALPASGVAFLNGADGMTEFICDQVRCGETSAALVVYDGSGSASSDSGSYANDPNSADGAKRVWAKDVRLDDQGYPTFTLCCGGFAADGSVEETSCALSLRGLHNVSNACAAAAIGRMAGMTIGSIATALASSQPESGRQEVLHASSGVMVVNDAYNANPDSMRASLALFSALSVEGRRFAILGDMGELGDHAPDCHRSVGAYAAKARLDRLICVGELARFIAQAAQDAGYPEAQIVCVDTGAEALAYAKEQLASGDAVLVKASHFMELDQVAKGLLN